MLGDTVRTRCIKKGILVTYWIDNVLSLGEDLESPSDAEWNQGTVTDITWANDAIERGHRTETRKDGVLSLLLSFIVQGRYPSVAGSPYRILENGEYGLPSRRRFGTRRQNVISRDVGIEEKP